MSKDEKKPPLQLVVSGGETIAQPPKKSQRKKVTAPKAFPPQPMPPYNPREIPSFRTGYTVDFLINQYYFTLKVSEFPDGHPADIDMFLHGEEDPFSAGILKTLCTSVSLGLQQGLPIAAYIQIFQEMDFPISGKVEQMEGVHTCTSLPNALAQFFTHRYVKLGE